MYRWFKKRKKVIHSNISAGQILLISCLRHLIIFLMFDSFTKSQHINSDYESSKLAAINLEDIECNSSTELS